MLRAAAAVVLVLASCLGGALLLAAMAGPPPRDAICDPPPARCAGDESYCGELVHFGPAIGPGYEDVDSERGYLHLREHSYIRRDLMMRVRHAAARVACVAARWPGNGGPIALLDMSEDGGAIPGTSRGDPGHPYGSHEGGRDIDIAYYQVGTPDNRGRPVCPCRVDGEPVYHCVGEPDRLDADRTALFIADLFEEPGMRVVGVDGRIGPRLERALRGLVARGIVPLATAARVRIRYETEDEGAGWFAFHHHHMHVSQTRPVEIGFP